MDTQRFHEAIQAPEFRQRTEILTVLHEDPVLKAILGEFVTRKADIGLGWLHDQYRINVAALHEAGEANERTPIPTLEQVRKATRPETAIWLNERRRAGHQDELVIVPNLEDIGLFGTSEQAGLIPQLDDAPPKKTTFHSWYRIKTMA